MSESHMRAAESASVSELVTELEKAVRTVPNAC